ncbi:MAG: methionine gamma-lyase family protein [Bacillota bacterium]|nr:methionine gamma-lyase family protein [Bacillota bacterium]
MMPVPEQDLAQFCRGLGCSRAAVDTVLEAARDLEAAGRFAAIRRLRAGNQLRVLAALQEAGIAEADFGGSSGYGYDDRGRERLEQAYARVMGTEAALVRIQIATGTQAIAMALFAVLRPGDELLSLTGPVYDSLRPTIGRGAMASSPEDEGLGCGSLADFGVSYRELPLKDGELDLDGIAAAIRPETAMVLLQRSRGYASRTALTAPVMQEAVRRIRQAAALQPAGSRARRLVIFVDNCYGEFVESVEPGALGVDLLAGSLIKNPGGGLAPSGGYVAGRRDLVEAAACRLNAPGLGSAVGPTLGLNRLLIQGFFLAPHIVAESLKGLVLAAEVLARRGFHSSPTSTAARGDLVQAVDFGDPGRLLTFCRAIQAAAPVDSFVTPVPAPLPGYDHEVVMAAGAFVSGSSIELSADGPLAPPYTAYMQGGLVYEQMLYALMLALDALEN